MCSIMHSSEMSNKHANSEKKLAKTAEPREQPGQKIKTLLLQQIVSGVQQSVYRHGRLLSADATARTRSILVDPTGGLGLLGEVRGIGEVSGVKQKKTSFASTCETFIMATRKRCITQNIPLCSRLPPPTCACAEASGSLRHHNKKLTERMWRTLLTLLPRFGEKLGLCFIYRWSNFPFSCSMSPRRRIIPGAPLARVPAG